jgi:hypothetical protein
VQVYGSTLKALVHEKFGDGIISAINFKLDIQKVENPEGGERAIITLNGEYLPTNPSEQLLVKARRVGAPRPVIPWSSINDQPA